MSNLKISAPRGTADLLPADSWKWQTVERILLQMDFYRRCGVKDLELQVNSLGDRESKQRYRDALVAFLSPKQPQLSEDSQRRLRENPLRILDSKDPRDQEAGRGAPPAV